MSPLVTVFMTCYNGSQYVAEAISSILNQTFTDFEFIIVDDGSTDDTWAVIQSFKDPRIKAQQNEKNLGVVTSGNIGLDSATGDYLAILDQDDIAMPNKLERQLAFMQAHPEVDICGSDILKFGNVPFKPHEQFPASHDVIWAGLIFLNYLAHSAIMLRLNKFRLHSIRYDLQYPYAHDYGLWVDASQYCRMANINEELIRYRLHQSNASRKYEKIQTNAANMIRKKMLGLAGVSFTDDEIILHNRLAGESWKVAFYPRKKIVSWLEKIKKECNKQYHQAVSELCDMYLSKYDDMHIKIRKFSYWKNKIAAKIIPLFKFSK